MLNGEWNVEAVFAHISLLLGSTSAATRGLAP
jgi:hypothetical protein